MTAGPNLVNVLQEISKLWVIWVLSSLGLDWVGVSTARVVIRCKTTDPGTTINETVNKLTRIWSETWLSDSGRVYWDLCSIILLIFKGSIAQSSGPVYDIREYRSRDCCKQNCKADDPPLAQDLTESELTITICSIMLLILMCSSAWGLGMLREYKSRDCCSHDRERSTPCPRDRPRHSLVIPIASFRDIHRSSGFVKIRCAYNKILLLFYLWKTGC